MRHLVPFVVLFGLVAGLVATHRALALTVVQHDPIGALVTGGQAPGSEVAVAAALGLLLTRGILLFGVPPAFVLALTAAVRRLARSRSASRGTGSRPESAPSLQDGARPR